MSNIINKLANPNIAKIKKYTPGKPISALSKELGLTNIIKLASNENPLGTSKKAIKAAQNSMMGISRYPVSGGLELKNILTQHLNITNTQITLGNGSNEILTLIAKAFLNSSVEVIFSEYAFIVYKIASQLTGANIVETPAKKWGHDLTTMLNKISAKTRLIFIANPNNPTGTLITKKTLKNFIEQVPKNIIVVIDEAYHEYVQNAEYSSALNYLEKHPNLIITRTFSKAYALAGLRVGYSISSPEIADILNRVRDPFNVNHVAQIAASTSLDDKKHIQKSIEHNQYNKKLLQDGFNNLNIKYIPSAANFISIYTKEPAITIYEKLLQHGIIIRPLDMYNMHNHLRITIGLEEENKQLLTAIKSVIL